MPVNRLQHIHRFVWLQLFLLAATVAHTQELRYQFKNYTPSDGLPSSETYQVLRDASNYMWFATDHGVTRYNGYEFETFNLPDNSVLGLYEDWKKRVWVYTFSGRLFYYENKKFEEYKWNKELIAAIAPGIIQAMYVDSAEKVHISSSGPVYTTITSNGAMKRQAEVNKRARYQAVAIKKPDFFVYAVTFPQDFQNTIFKHDTVTELSITSAKKKLLITLPKLIQHERCKLKQLSNGSFMLYTKDCYVFIKSEREYRLITTSYTVDDVEEVGDHIFLATEQGISVLNKKGELVEKYLEGIHVTSIEKDHEGGVWMTTLTNAVYYLNHFRIKHLAQKGYIIDKRINLVYKLKDSTILAGVHGNEVLRFKTGSFLESMRFRLRDITSFYEINPSVVLIGGSIGWFDVKFWDEDNAIRFGNITYYQIQNSSNFVVKDSSVYTGPSTGIYQYKIGNFKFYDKGSTGRFRTAKLFVENSGTILVGNHFGLWRYDQKDITKYDSTKQLLSSRITDIAYYQNKILCLSTRGNGMLLLYNDSIYQVKHSDGIVSDNIRKVYIDKNDIWLASNNGISIVTVRSLNPFHYTVRNLSVQDGLLSNEINSIIEDGKNVAVASNHGISFLSREALMDKKMVELPLLIKQVKVNNSVIAIDGLSSLNFRKRNLNISYEALNYSAAGRNNYRYRLLGYDTNWIYTNNREIQFNPLPYGDYRLQIQAKREYDQWNGLVSTVELPIQCKPPFWSTTWFWLLISAVVLILLLLGFRNRIQLLKQRQKEREELQNRIGASEQMALKAQMNPHFIFNSLNSIQQYVIESDVRGANEFISGFSRLIRQTLEFSSKEFISLQEEVSYLTTYLDLEKARMESKFEYTVHVETLQPASQLELPPLLLQPYVENALRHGIKYRKDADGLIQLFFIEYPGVLECIVEDNGIGRKRAMELKAVNPIEYQSRGMALTAERVLLLNEQREQKIEIVIEDLMNTDGSAAGTRIRVRFPIE